MPVFSGIWLRDPPINSSRLSTPSTPFQLLLSTQIVWTIASGYNCSLLRTAGSSDAIVFILFQESLGFCVDFDRSPPSKIEPLLLPISQVVMEQQPSLSSAHRASFRTPNSQVPGLETDCFMFFLHHASPSASDLACPRWGVPIVVVDDPPSFRTLNV